MGLFVGTSLAPIAEEVQRQADLEDRSKRLGVKRYRHLYRESIKRGQGSALKPADRLLTYWLAPYVESITEEVDEISKGIPGKNRATYGPLMLVLNPETMAAIAMHSVVSKLLTYDDGLPFATLSRIVGEAINGEINVTWLRKHNPSRFKYLRQNAYRFKTGLINRICNHEENGRKWPAHTQICVGQVLIYLLIGVATVGGFDEADFIPALTIKVKHGAEKKGARKTINIVNLSEEASKIISDGHRARENLMPRYLPMVVPPLAWSDKQRGGYITMRHPLIRRLRPYQQSLVKSADLSNIHHAVNILNACPWRINRAILDVQEQIWADGGDLAGIPRREDLPFPPEADLSSGPGRLAYHRCERANQELAGERRSYEMRLDVARRVVDRPRIYMVHTGDWRGRLYPLPMYLTHHMDHTARALLQMAEPRPLGDRGWYWLRVNMAGAWGHDRVSYDDQVSWVDAITPTLIDMARDPMRHREWMDTDAPFESLAYAMEIDAALKGNPHDYAGHMPTRIDGTCSGVQHYTGMTLDPNDAAAVNMTPRDHPGDVYGQVASEVSDLVDADAEHGVAEALILRGKITRGIVKRYCMTQVYGVTKHGGRVMISQELDGVIPESDVWDCSIYLARVQRDVMTTTVCASAQKLMAWIREITGIVVATGNVFEWDAPSGLPIAQPYRKDRERILKTFLHHVSIHMQDDTEPPAAMRQINASAPNFIHSLDASHLMAAVAIAHKRGLHLATVHDCFGCHPRDTDIAHECARRAFINLHTIDRAAELADGIRKRISGIVIPDPPPRGTYDLEQVMASKYMFK